MFSTGDKVKVVRGTRGEALPKGSEHVVVAAYAAGCEHGQYMPCTEHDTVILEGEGLYLWRADRFELVESADSVDTDAIESELASLKGAIARIESLL